MIVFKKYVMKCLKEFGDTVIGNEVIKQHGIEKVEQELTKQLGKKVVIATEVHHFEDYGRQISADFVARNKPTINYIAKVVK